MLGVVRRWDHPSSLACINYPPERWALLTWHYCPIVKGTGWTERSPREEKDKKRRESQSRCCPDAMTAPREIDHTPGLCSDKEPLPRSSKALSSPRTHIARCTRDHCTHMHSHAHTYTLRDMCTLTSRLTQIQTNTCISNAVASVFIFIFFPEA